MENQINLGPFTSLLDIPGIDGPEDIFGNLPESDGAENPFAMGSSTSDASTSPSDLSYGGNPFAGDNFWNIFAGGVNPSYLGTDSGNSFGSGF